LKELKKTLEKHESKLKIVNVEIDKEQIIIDKAKEKEAKKVAKEKSDKTNNIPGAAYFILIGIGMNIMYTGRFGVKNINNPIKPKIAPEAPTAKVLKSCGNSRLAPTKNNPANRPEIK